MASSLGTQDKTSRNVELNIVPFIDLMSCLTAFLLVTAVWINMANIKNEPAGKARDQKPEIETPKLAILLDWDQILVTETPSGEIRQMPANDWRKLESALAELKVAAEPQLIEIAASSTNDHPVPYQSLIAAMDTASKVGFPRIGVTDPTSLSR